MREGELGSLHRVDAVALLPLLKVTNATEPFRRAGLDPRVLSQHDRRWVPAALTDRIWDASAGAQPDLPFRVAETIEPSSFGLLTYLLSSCDDVGSALARLPAVYPLLSRATAYRFEVDSRGGHLVVDLRGKRPPIVEQFALAVALSFARRQAVGSLVVREVRVTQRFPEAHSEQALARGFGAPVRYGAMAPGWSIEPASLSIPFRRRDPGLLAILEDHAQTLLTRGDAEEIAERVRDQIVIRGARCTLRAGEIARDLAMAERTLRRKLRVEGTTFQAELDRVLAAAARERLGTESVEAVGAALGFSEASAFRRAFRRWFGAAPRSLNLRRG